ncbi:MAG: metalloprotease PmbA [Betaproteobacteria bacterium]|nr:MAG: metalloprotease PmbA [Betaproteobacteria bacterium]
MASDAFTYQQEQLKEIADDALRHATAAGASSAELDVHEGFGQTVTVRRDEVETIEYNRDKGMSVTVYIGKQRGHASTSDLTPEAVRTTVEAALSIARLTASDEYAALADPALLATSFPDLDLYHPWGLSVEDAVRIARDCERAAFDADSRINNSDGATVSAQQAHFVYANSNGFVAGYPSTRHYVSCAVTAGKGDNMQRDSWWSMARAHEDLDSFETVGETAGRRTARRLDAKKIATREVPVLFESPVASGLLGHFVAAVSGASLYRKQSFLLDSLESRVFPDFVRIDELPHLRRGLASSAFDNEGVETQPRAVVDQGVVKGYFLGSYAARKLGMRSTGNAGGAHNLVMRSTGDTFEALLKKMGRGLLVTDLLGHGTNMVTGDYSRGAAGFWVEDGELAFPVHEVTVAGNLKQMFSSIAAIADDALQRTSRQTGSILIDSMTVAGD